MALAYLHHDTGNGLRQSEMNADGRHNHIQYRYPEVLHYATVKVSGVALTNVRLHD